MNLVAVEDVGGRTCSPWSTAVPGALPGGRHEPELGEVLDLLRAMPAPAARVRMPYPVAFAAGVVDEARCRLWPTRNRACPWRGADGRLRMLVRIDKAKEDWATDRPR